MGWPSDVQSDEGATSVAPDPANAPGEAPRGSDEHFLVADNPPVDLNPPKFPVLAQIRDGGTGRFVTGNSASKGRPKGSRNKLKEAVLATVLEHYNANGKKVLENLALTDPGVYMRIILQLLPSDDTPRDDLGDLTKDELDEILIGIYRARQVRELIQTV